MSLDRDPDALLARIDWLERRAVFVTRLLAATVTLLVLALAAVLAADREVAAAQGRGTVPDEIVARRFTLVDASGKPRARLHIDEHQAAGLALSDPAGQTRVLLNTDGEVSKLAITGARQGFPRILLAQNGDVQVLTLEDANTSFIGLQHSTATPAILVKSGEHLAELGIAEVFAPRAKPTRTPRLTLTQGDRTLATLPAAPAPR